MVERRLGSPSLSGRKNGTASERTRLEVHEKFPDQSGCWFENGVVLRLFRQKGTDGTPFSYCSPLEKKFLEAGNKINL
jgi:hypothetical protein